MSNWFTIALALSAAGHFSVYGTVRFIAGYRKSYTLSRTIGGFFVTLPALPILMILGNQFPATFVGTAAFYSASALLSIAVLVALGRKIDTKAAELAKETMNRIASEGFDAFNAGVSRTANPYVGSDSNQGSQEHFDYWDRGFKLAEKRHKREQVWWWRRLALLRFEH